MVEPLLTAASPSFTITDSDEPDWSADLNYFVPWHWLANNEPQGICTALYTHCNPGMEEGLKVACSRMNEVVVMSESGQRELDKLGVSTKSIIIPAYIVGFTPPKQRVLIVGDEQPNGRKRSWLLLDLAWIMDLSSFSFTIVGTGWEDVVRKLLRLGIDVTYHPNLSPEALLQAYHNADIFLATGFVEGGPLPVLEALAVGLPVVSPRYGYAADYPDFVDYYYDTASLKENLELAAKQVHLSYSIIHNNHSLSKYVNGHLDLFTRLASTPSQPSSPAIAPSSRYEWITRIVDETHARYLMEIGTWTGESALRMIDAAKRHHKPEDIYYYGYDLFRPLTAEEIKREFSKQPWTKSLVGARLAHSKANIYLHEGDTRETLHPITPYTGGPMDFIFVDGGHSWETIESDWEGIQSYIGPNTVILFDDCYYNAPEDIRGIGAQKLLGALQASGKWNIDYLRPVESWPQDNGQWTLHVGMAAVTHA